ncbi:class I SAM-dependent methyltransferase [Thiothrix nivea]|uniref:Methyltransferase type 11 n=1 Tax=Thiothrix nivea (strain ATCC 35100 / DSM 5205 / JP2) TaxID=870187 RepID=A0A656HBI7_THINJ|nr:methyltransferase domain-containing protein [Thiothrix nivea]EIJ32820.1 Methyltransferase type 11 [Thiothrix nivea DSM 5205]
MDRAKRAAFEFTLTWQSEAASHCDRYYAGKVSYWRDIFPFSMETCINQLEPGQSCTQAFPAGELVPAHEARRVATFAASQFEGKQRFMLIEPRVGRFYPQGFAWQALNCYKGNFQPFRVIGKAEGKLAGDPNHPLARYPLTLQARYVETLPPIEEHGGACNDIAEMVTEKGPGLQAPYPGVATDFYATYPFTRMDEREDALFYTNERLVNHLDKTAIAEVSAIYAKLLKPGMKVLDLMSSWVSHLPASLTDLHVTGLGMNQAELDANPRLNASVVQDLNQNPQLPFADNNFDAVICTVSVEYLTQPLAVMRELARVTSTGGVVVMTFSERWFPPKVIDIWPEMHPFERQGLVLDYFLKTDGLTELHTESIRGLPRPEDDKHSRETHLSDPVYAVWGAVTG